MKVVLYNKVCKESARKLARAIGADLVNPFETVVRSFNNYEHVFNYGCNRNMTFHPQQINSANSVARCIDKLSTFKFLKQVGVPVPEFTTNKEEAKRWSIIVARKNRFGAKAEDLEYIRKGQTIPDAQLYTKFYKSKHEFRIMVFKGCVIGRYKKNEYGLTWNFDSMEPIGFEHIDSACVKAANALNIDFVGLDVLSNSQTKFVILEANSAPIITPEAIKAIKEYYEV